MSKTVVSWIVMCCIFMKNTFGIDGNADTEIPITVNLHKLGGPEAPFSTNIQTGDNYGKLKKAIETSYQDEDPFIMVADLVTYPDGKVLADDEEINIEDIHDKHLSVITKAYYPVAVNVFFEQPDLSWNPIFYPELVFNADDSKAELIKSIYQFLGLPETPGMEIYVFYYKQEFEYEWIEYDNPDISLIDHGFDTDIHKLTAIIVAPPQTRDDMMRRCKREGITFKE